MKRSTHIYLLAVLLLGTTGCGGRTASQHVSAEPTCIRSAEGSCRTPFHALYAHPLSSYKGLVLRISGCLRGATRNRFLIYPDQETARFGRREYALLIDPSAADVASSLSLYAGQCVVIDGRLIPVEGSGDLDDVWGELDVVKGPAPLSDEETR